MRVKGVLLAVLFAAGVALAAGGPNALQTASSSGGAPILSGFPPVDNPAETLHYDGNNNNGVGLTRGGTYRGAVRFTPTYSCTVKAILFYQRDPSDNEYVFVYGEQNDTVPGATLDSAPYTGSGGLQWKTINLARPLIVVAGTDFWACVRVTHDSGAFPLGTDAGPMVRNRGGFISTGGDRWQQLEDQGLDYNWNIRAIVEPIPGPAHDVGVTRILSPATSVPPGTYQPQARVVNFGTNAESDIPVYCQIDSAGTTVYDEMVTHAGPLQPGNRATINFPNWTTGPALNSYDLRMFTALSGDLDPSNDTTTQTTNTVAVLPLMDHDTGYCRLTVTCFGSIGYDNPPADAGNGFRYPKTAASALFLASVAVGNAPEYVVDRHFGHPPTGPINADWEPVDSLRAVLPPDLGDEHFYAKYDDQGHSGPQGLTVTQNTYMTADPNYDDFIIFVCEIKNEGAGAIDDAYAAVFSDFDVGTANTNIATSDTVSRFGYMYNVSSQNPTVGIKILEPQSFANMAAIDHDIWVYPDSCVSDTQKYRFMSGNLVQRNSNRPYDWSLCLSVGPFDLGVGETYRFSFAFVGGTSNALARANADAAQTWYNTNVGVQELTGRAGRGIPVSVAPNPFRRAASISYSTRVAGPLTLAAYDAGGRLVDSRTVEVKAGQGSYLWQPTGLARGVYFLSVRTPDEDAKLKVLRLE